MQRSLFAPGQGVSARVAQAGELMKGKRVIVAAPVYIGPPPSNANWSVGVPITPIAFRGLFTGKVTGFGGVTLPAGIAIDSQSGIVSGTAGGIGSGSFTCVARCGALTTNADAMAWVVAP